MLRRLAKRGREYTSALDNRVQGITTHDQGFVADLKMAVQMKMHDYPKAALGVATQTWSSPKVLQDWPIAATKRLVDIFQFYLPVVSKQPDSKWELQAWANVKEPGGGVAEHDHQDDQNKVNQWSGVFYLTGGSDIVFVRDGKEAYRVTPKPGLLTIFPSHLRHFVEPWRGPGSRISIAFNAREATP